MTLTKAGTLAKAREVEDAIRQNQKTLALTRQGEVKKMVAGLGEPVVTPPPPPPIEPPAPDGELLWSGSKVADFPEKLFKPNRAIEIVDPADAARKVISLTAANADTGEPTSNPRCQIGTPYLLKPESTYWGHTRLWFGEGFPTSINTWMTLLSIWAPSFGGDGAPFHFMTWDAKTLRVERNSNSHDDTPMWIPLVRNAWMDLVWCEHLSSTKGWAEVWLNGIQQKFNHFSGEPTRLEWPTIDNTNSGGNQNVRLEVYYGHNGIPGLTPATVLYDGLKLGTTRSSVGA